MARVHKKGDTFENVTLCNKCRDIVQEWETSQVCVKCHCTFHTYCLVNYGNETYCPKCGHRLS